MWRCIRIGKINIFTQKVLYSGYSLEEVKRITCILKQNQIEYEVKEWNKRSLTGRNGGTFGELEKYSTIYKICVHHKDFDEAEFLVRQV